jgi:hypothetical protein
MDGYHQDFNSSRNGTQSGPTRIYNHGRPIHSDRASTSPSGSRSQSDRHSVAVFENENLQHHHQPWISGSYIINAANPSTDDSVRSSTDSKATTAAEDSNRTFICCECPHCYGSQLYALSTVCTNVSCRHPACPMCVWSNSESPKKTSKKSKSKSKSKSSSKTPPHASGQTSQVTNDPDSTVIARGGREETTVLFTCHLCVKNTYNIAVSEVCLDCHHKMCDACEQETVVFTYPSDGDDS